MQLKTLFFMSFFISTMLVAQAQQPIRLYEGKAPGSEAWTWGEKENFSETWKTQVVYNVADPTLTAYLPNPNNANGTAVVIAPGGGFHALSINSEGVEVAKWLNAKGITAFVLKYRLVHSLTDDPAGELTGKMNKKPLDEANAIETAMCIADGKKAVEYVRTHATDFKIDPKRIGFMGFSAGGYVTMGVGLTYTPENRPDFLAPVYPYMGALSKKPVPTDAPPLFVVVANDDQLQLAPASAAIYGDWLAAKKSAEMHVYAKGGHGFGMRKQDLPSDTWIERFGEWLEVQGFLQPIDPTKPTAKQLAQWKRENEARQKNDWGYLAKYKAENSALLAQPANPNRVLFLGNSITENWMRLHPEFFSKNYVARGISGQTSAQTLVRFRQDVLDLKPKVVIINIGTNDIAQNTGLYDPNFTIGNIVSMVELAKANKIKVILASVHPATEFPWSKEIQNVATKIIQLNTRIQDYAKQNKLVYLDYHAALKNQKNGMSPEMAADGVHPTIEAYKIMEEWAEKAIVAAMKQR
jgi:acetyl esterase/lipase/lysophospholipase L1-like esterase